MSRTNTNTGGGGGGGITSINSDNTAAQVIAAGTGITIVDNGGGIHTISVTGGGSQNLTQVLTVGNDGGGINIFNVPRLQDSGAGDSIDVENRLLYDSSAGTALNWSTPSQLIFNAYPNTRDDTGTFTPTSFAYFGAGGEVYEAPFSALPVNPPSGTPTQVTYYDANTGLLTSDALFFRNQNNFFQTFIQSANGANTGQITVDSNASYLSQSNGTVSNSFNVNLTDLNISSSIVGAASSIILSPTIIDEDLNDNLTTFRVRNLMNSSGGTYSFQDITNSHTANVSLAAGGASVAYSEPGIDSNASWDATEFITQITDSSTYRAWLQLTPAGNTYQYFDNANSRTGSVFLSSTNSQLNWNDSVNGLNGGININGGGTSVSYQDNTAVTYSSSSYTNQYALLNFENQTSFIDTGFLANDQIATMGITNASGNNTTFVVNDLNQYFVANKYPSTRDDTGTFTPVNFIYTDTTGIMYSAPLSAIPTSISIGETIVSGTDPSVLFIQSGLLAQDPTHFAYVPTLSFYVEINDGANYQNIISADSTSSQLYFSDTVNGILSFVDARATSLHMNFSDSTSGIFSLVNLDENQNTSTFNDSIGANTFSALSSLTPTANTSEYLNIVSGLLSKNTLDTNQNRSEYTDGTNFTSYSEHVLGGNNDYYLDTAGGNTASHALNGGGSSIGFVGSGFSNLMSLTSTAFDLKLDNIANTITELSGTLGGDLVGRITDGSTYLHTLQLAQTGFIDLLYGNVSTNTYTGVHIVDQIAILGTTSGGNGTKVRVDDVTQQTTLNSGIVNTVDTISGVSPAVLPGKYFIDVDVSGGTCDPQLPNAPADGTTFVISDFTGNAGINQIFVSATGADSIHGIPVYTMSIPYQSITIHYRAASTEWIIS